MGTFTVVNESTLAQAISRAEKRLVYIAPGLTALVAEAITSVLSRPQFPATTVIIDTDPEVCRLGYGTVEGLEKLQELAASFHISIRYQAGLRIGVLICDESVQVYSPIPLLIEAGSSRTDQPNAVVINQDSLLTLLHACAAEGETSENIPLPSDAELGAKPATPEMLANSLEELVRNPPKSYDVSRIERVFSSKLQYVEFEVTGYRLSSRRVHIPNDLLIGEDPTLKTRLHNSFTLLERKDTLKVDIPDRDPGTNEPKVVDGTVKMISYSEKSIEIDRKKIYADFLISIPKYGQLINRSRRNDFDNRISWFKTRIEDFKKGVSKQLQREIEKSVQELVEVLLPGIKERTPDRLLKSIYSLQPSDDELRRVLVAELNHAFGSADRLFSPEVRVIFKDITYETIKDDKFREQLIHFNRGADLTSMGSFFSEFDAAPELNSDDR